MIVTVLPLTVASLAGQVIVILGVATVEDVGHRLRRVALAAGPVERRREVVPPLGEGDPGNRERGRRPDRDLGQLDRVLALELAIDPDRDPVLADVGRRDRAGQVDGLLVRVRLGRQAERRGVRGDQLGRARARARGDLRDRLRERRRDERDRASDEPDPGEDDDPAQGDDGRRRGGCGGTSACPTRARSCGAGRGGSGMAVGSPVASRAAGRPVDGGRGRTWEVRWRRLVIELHCRTPGGMGRPRRRQPALYSGAVSGRAVTSAENEECVQARKPNSAQPSGPPDAHPSGSARSPGSRRGSLRPAPVPATRRLPVLARGGAFGLPNLRRNVCPHFYMTGTRGAIPIQAPHLLKALIRQDAERLALPAPRRRPPRAGLRQRRLPDPALQPVRLLRGRADPGVTAVSDLSYAEALAGRSRSAAGSGSASGWAGPGRSCASSATRSSAFRGALVGGTNGKGSVLALAGSRAAGRGLPRRRDAQAAPRHATASGSRSTAGWSTRPTFARLVERGPARPPTGSPAGSASRPSSSS